eukprot:scaffold215075_cov22-Prasinocladus_malaysianus.AAC.1
MHRTGREYRMYRLHIFKPFRDQKPLLRQPDTFPTLVCVVKCRYSLSKFRSGVDQSGTSSNGCLKSIQLKVSNFLQTPNTQYRNCCAMRTYGKRA